MPWIPQIKADAGIFQRIIAPGLQRFTFVLRIMNDDVVAMRNAETVSAQIENTSAIDNGAQCLAVSHFCRDAPNQS
jgi:hypothetical protein